MVSGGARSRDRRAVVAELRALVGRGQKSGAPVLRAADDFAVVGQDHERGQVLVRGAQPVGDPRAQRRPAGEDRTRVHLADRADVVQPVRPAGADDGDVVDMLRDVRIPVGDPDAALPVLLPLPLRAA